LTATVLPALICPAVVHINHRLISRWHLRPMLPVTGIARETRKSGTSAVTRSGMIARPVPWLIGVILADPSSAPAYRAFGIHGFIVAPDAPTFRVSVLAFRPDAYSFHAALNAFEPVKTAYVVFDSYPQIDRI